MRVRASAMEWATRRSADGVDAPEGGLGRLGDDLLPVSAAGLRDVDRDDAVAGRPQVGLEIEHRPLVVDELVARVELVEELDHRSVLPAEILVEEGILPVGAPADADDEVAAVLGRSGVEAPFLLVGPMVDQLVLGLRRAEAVVEDFLVVVPGLVFLAGFRRVVAGVVEALVVLRPGGAGELRPLEEVRVVISGGDVAHPPLVPVGPGAGNGVGHQGAVVREGEVGEGHGAVGRERVGVQQDAGFRIEGGERVEDRLVLQAVIAGVEVAAAGLERGVEALDVPELGEAGLDPRAFRDGVEVCAGARVLGLDPGRGFLGVIVLQPPVGVGDLDAVERVGVVDAPRLAGVGKGGDCKEQEDRPRAHGGEQRRMWHAWR